MKHKNSSDKLKHTDEETKQLLYNCFQNLLSDAKEGISKPSDLFIRPIAMYFENDY
ncbi:hypothetical protein R077811_01100 [Convivina intestini]|nr:hypothetical protein R077811_01100 [Convivina intestini]